VWDLAAGLVHFTCGSRLAILFLQPRHGLVPICHEAPCLLVNLALTMFRAVAVPRSNMMPLSQARGHLLTAIASKFVRRFCEMKSPDRLPPPM
jgi:hypothetical protein